MRDALKATIIFLILAVATLGLAKFAATEDVVGKTALRVLMKQRVGESTFLDVQPLVVPTFRFRVEGGLVGEDKILFGCLEVNETRRGPQGVLYPTVVVVCDRGLKLVLTEVDMTMEVK